MNLKDVLLDAGKAGRDMLKIPRLLAADRAKFSRKEMVGIVTDNILVGRMDVCESILKTHQVNPYMTVDELMGDLQLMLVDDNNTLKKNNPHHPYKLKVEDLILESKVMQ